MRAFLFILIVSLASLSCDSRKAKARLNQQGIAATDDSLFRYARDGDVEKVRLLLQAGCSPNAEEKFVGRTALMYAAEKGHLDLVKFLLASKANVDQAVRKKVYRSGLPLPGWESRTEHPYPGWTALMFAAHGGHCEIVRALLAAGADPNAAGVPDSSKGDNNTTPLITASQRARTECVELLLKSGANVNASDLMGHTALSVAANGHIAELLLKAGADIHAQDRYGGTVLRNAVGRMDEKMVRLLVAAGAEVNARDRSGRTAMFSAHGKMVPLLIELGADINAKDNQGMTHLLHVARQGGYRGNVMPLFKAGASLEGLSAWDAFLLLQDGVNARDMHVVKAALDAGADVKEARSREGHIMLLAARAGNVEIMRLLLEHGAEVNPPHSSGITPLMQAAIAGHTEAVRLLLSHDADLHARDQNGFTALSWALKVGRKATADVLREAGATEL